MDVVLPFLAVLVGGVVTFAGSVYVGRLELRRGVRMELYLHRIREVRDLLMERAETHKVLDAAYEIQVRAIVAGGRDRKFGEGMHGPMEDLAIFNADLGQAEATRDQAGVTQARRNLEEARRLLDGTLTDYRNYLQRAPTRSSKSALAPLASTAIHFLVCEAHARRARRGRPPLPLEAGVAARRGATAADATETTSRSCCPTCNPPTTRCSAPARSPGCSA